MRTILIAQREQSFANALAADLAAVGYRPITCPGPWPPAARCIRDDIGYCPLSEAAEALIYDPDLVIKDGAGCVHCLATASALAHPDLPLILAWPGEERPASVDEVLAEVAWAAEAPNEAGKLVELVWELAGPPFDVQNMAS